MTKRKFTTEDQNIFAKISGDYNPIHMDPVIARRLIFGGQVAHGVHVLLWAFDRWMASKGTMLWLKRLTVYFHQPVRLDEEVRWQVLNESDHRVSLQVIKKATLCVRINAEWSSGLTPSDSDIPDQEPPIADSRVLTSEAIASDSGVLDLYLPRNLFARQFSNLITTLSPLQSAVILATTRLVGMRCPGHHSVFSEIDLNFDSPSHNIENIKFRVSGIDQRFSLVSLAIEASGLKGRIKSFLRPSPQDQKDFKKMLNLVESAEFEGQKALVIGGSRGLGEVTAKLLAAGGAAVSLTYYQGGDDARKIVDEILAGGGKADCHSVDVRNPAESFNSNWPALSFFTHLYYYATPHITPGMRGEFNEELFNRFCIYYVIGLAEVIKTLCQKCQELRFVFYPSSDYITEIPDNLGEYAAAKAASETLCRYLNQTLPGINIHSPRLPRLATDQTISLTTIDRSDPVPILLKELRAFNRLQ